MMQKQFSVLLLEWFKKNGRRDLPWQHPRSAYRVWISEIMLQQTQVKTVIPYFLEFMLKFPELQQLAEASEDSVLAKWSGLGYYSRARNLHQTAKIIAKQHKGEFPSDLTKLTALPGIGPSTAAAIASQAFNQPTAILDGNVKRVLCRYFLVDGWPEQTNVKKKLWQLAQQCMPTEQCADYTQAIMDLGATCCKSKNPHCESCPLESSCLARQKNLIGLYPQKKLKKTLVTKQQQFLLLFDIEKRIYLEKRPPTGIWAGLWCMPALDINDSALEYIAKNYDFSCQSLQKLLFIRHSFSHFHLEISSFALETKINANSLKETAGKWFAAKDLLELGLAKPMNDIINYFFSQTVNLIPDLHRADPAIGL
ncbi:MAG: A/G-specific adenine glycosylase [Tatlockia sp.]|nr:A/G-specific adenine glycosylase [Tatlockia sp.]